MRGKRLGAIALTGLFAASALAQDARTTVDPNGQVTPVAGDQSVQISPPSSSGDVRRLIRPGGEPLAASGGCDWDNGIIPNGFSGRAVSPPNFPDIRVVDDIDVGGGCQITTLRANLIEDAGWVPGELITVYAYEDTGSGPGALMDSVDVPFTRTAMGVQYFGRDDYEYFIEGIGITLPAGVSWLGMRNGDGSGSGTNYWMTSDGGVDGPGSDTGWFSLDGGNSFAPEGAGWHHAFEMTGGPEGMGACCLPDGSCTDDVPGSECRQAGGRFAIDTLCVDIDPPCEEQTGRCCIFGKNEECLVVTATECRDLGGEFAGFESDCEGEDVCDFVTNSCCLDDGSCTDDVPEAECLDVGGRWALDTFCVDIDPPCEPLTGACCIFPDCLGTTLEAECDDLGGAWFFGETCPEFACPEVIDCFWDNNIIPNGFSGRAISPPNFPDIRVVDDVEFNDPGCEIGTLKANIIEDAGWVPGELITVYVYEDNGGVPGALLDSVDTSFIREATGDNYFGRDDFDYTMEGVGLELPGGVSWIGMRNADGSGAGTNYWMTSDGGADTSTGYFSLDGGNTFNAEGAGWHHAFEFVEPPGNGACCLPDGSCTDDVPGNECRDAGGRFGRETLCVDLNPPCEEQTGRCCIEAGGGCQQSCERECDGDVDCDGFVNPVDFGLCQAAMGSDDPQDLCDFDMDCDGVINPVDCGLIQTLFGTCEEPRGTCDDGGGAECAVITPTECGQRGGDFGGFGSDCEDDPCGFAEGACCLELDCAGTTREAACDDMGGVWYEGQTCPEFSCPDVVPCAWDNGMIPNGFSGRAISPPNFPDIRVVDDIVAEGAGCTVINFHANVIEDAGWTDDGIITVLIYEDTGSGPGALIASVDSEYERMATGDNYFGRDDFDYWIEGISVDLPAGTSWIGIRNAGGGGAGTNYWMTSDGGSDGPGSDTGWFSLDGGNSFQPEGAGWHHAFEVVP